MPIDTRMVGQNTSPISHTVDARWLMAYAAALGDFDPRYMDTSAGPVVGHPLFPVCLEWPAILASRELPGFSSATAEERARGVHAAHDLHIYRPIRDGDRLLTTVTLTDVRAKSPGAVVMYRIDTQDEASGELVCRTWQTGISRGVDVEGKADPVDTPPPMPLRPDRPWQGQLQIPVAAGAAHTYTECARIWNPIHTDRAVALAAGLPDIILHGTATLALAVSALTRNAQGGQEFNVCRVGGQFRAMVEMPSTLTLNYEESESKIQFEVLNSRGEPAIANGFVLTD